MDTYGLVGWPLGHSFSAKFFAEKFQRESINAQYLNFELPSVDPQLHQIVSDTPTLRGLNVTIPHKQAVIPLLDELSDEARAIGAVNVIRITRQPDGRPYLKGYNSDVVGFTQSIRPLLRPHHQQALVLGTGGASKAVIHGLQRLGLTTVSVSRNPGKGQLSYDDITPQLIEQYTVIVNCTPLGMFPNVDACPSLPYDALTTRHLLYDLVYNPLQTRFLTLGETQGATIKNGLEMLHVQAIASWDFWHEP